jgi:hypothetical protein
MSNLLDLIAPLSLRFKGADLRLAVRSTLAAYILAVTKAKKQDVKKLMAHEMSGARELFEKVLGKKRKVIVGKQVNTDGLPAPLGNLTDLFTEEIRALTDALQAGTITPTEWEMEFEYALVRYQLAGAMAGLGTPDLPDEMLTSVSDFITEQFGFLGDFTVEIAASVDEWQAGWNARAESYAGSIKQPYWTGEVKMLPLPAMPGDGTSQCVGNCRCSWSIDVVDEAAGDYDCTWVYGDTEDHCQTCKVREREWNPLRIRGGMVQDKEFHSKSAPEGHEFYGNQWTDGAGGESNSSEDGSIGRVVSSANTRLVKVVPGATVREVSDSEFPSNNSGIENVAGYNARTKELLINRDAEYWKMTPQQRKEFADKQYRIKNWSTNSEDHPILHEIGHAAQATSDPRQYSGSDYMNDDQMDIAYEVSKYSMHGSQEFVAETWAGLSQGKKYSDKVITLYYQFGGPSHH